MRVISVSRGIRSSGDVVWRLITEFAQWPSWGPTVAAVKSEAKTVASGVRGTVVTPFGLAIPFVITDVDPGVSWSWRVAGVNATGHRVEATGDETCRLVFTVPWPFAPYVVVLIIGIRRVKRLAESQVG